ncbi:hypothetical protein CLPUN_23100 [Clostridium puniceum]|uniref:Lipoprotein n=1 Tax=Clostridium puniceum TaxID=29367 RepID=A0A1S8TI82_9CLOT|nr:hypothetical protein [Clostridium puniceum]OOM77411.1 hypothetical protein CLPUN_23100 [Clostridium puniceum]
MKRKSILALILVTVIVVSLSLVGCGRNHSGTKTDNNITRNNAVGTPNTENNATGNNADGSPNITTNPAGTPNTDAYGNANTNAGNNVGGTANNSIGTNEANSQGISDSLKYSAINFRDDIVNAGYNLKEAANRTKNYFTGNETDYLAGNDVVRVYEYNSAQDLEGDIKRISQNGLTINGTDANYTNKPYYYRKGNSLIVYEGNDPAYVNQFKSMYGNALIP